MSDPSKKKVKVVFYIAQYPVRWTAQNASHFFPSLTDLFIPTPSRLLREAELVSVGCLQCKDIIQRIQSGHYFYQTTVNEDWVSSLLSSTNTNIAGNTVEVNCIMKV